MYRWELTITDNAGGLDVPLRDLVRAHVHTMRAALVSYLSATLSSDDVQVTLARHEDELAHGTAVVGARAGRGLGLALRFQLRRLRATEPLAPLAEPDKPGPSAVTSATPQRSARARCLQLLEASTAAASDRRTDTARDLLQQARDCDAATVEAFRRAVAQHRLARPGTPQWQALIATLDEQ